MHRLEKHRRLTVACDRGTVWSPARLCEERAETEGKKNQWLTQAELGGAGLDQVMRRALANDDNNNTTTIIFSFF
jgi:hypothetical protein